MKTLILVTTGWVVFFIAGFLSVQSQAQEVEGYTFIRGMSGTQVCMGRWVPSRDVALPGSCEGQLVDMAQFTAISTRLSVDMLNQLLLALSSIDQKLAVNNEQFERLIKATVETQASIDQQVEQVSGFLYETINNRFDALPEEILANDLFKQELTRLKEDILKEVEKRYPARPKPSTK